MFWIGFLVGCGIVALIWFGCARYGMKYFGLNFTECCDIVEGLDGIGNNRASEINMVFNKGTDIETTRSIEFKEK